MEVLIQLVKAIAAEIHLNANYPSVRGIFLYSAILTLGLFFKSSSSLQKVIVSIRGIRKDALVFILVGASYLLFCAFLAWRAHFSPLYYRFTSPGIFIIVIGIFIHFKNSALTNRFFIILIIGVATTMFIKVNEFSNNDMKYLENVTEIEARYKLFEEGSVIVFADRHINYIRPDLTVLRPFYYNLDRKKESVSEFTSRVNMDWELKNIYIEINDIILDTINFHCSWGKIYQDYHNKEFIQL